MVLLRLMRLTRTSPLNNQRLARVSLVVEITPFDAEPCLLYLLKYTQYANTGRQRQTSTRFYLRATEPPQLGYGDVPHLFNIGSYPLCFIFYQIDDVFSQYS